jgi:ABC-type transport system involved in multi-copper enzyme maturation permease subunit
VSPFVETRLIVARELRKNLRSIKGLILLGVSLLGAAATTLRLPKFEIQALSKPDVSPELLHAAKAELIDKLYYGEDKLAESMADAPLKLVFIFYLAVWLAPLLVTLLGFDAISSEIQYRTVRYWTVRARRGSYVAGKFFGLWAVVAAVTFVMHALVWIVTIARGEAGLGETLSWGLRFWIFALPISAVWCGLATFIGSLFKTPMLSLLVICAVFFVLFFAGFFLGHGVPVNALTYFYPNSYDAWLASPVGHRAGLGIAICAGYTALPLAAATFLFGRKDLA